VHTYTNARTRAPQADGRARATPQSAPAVSAGPGRHSLGRLTDGNGVIQRRTIQAGRGGSSNTGESDDSGAQESADAQAAQELVGIAFAMIGAAQKQLLQQSSTQPKHVSQFAVANGALNPNAAKALGGAIGNAANATLNWGNVTAQNTSTSVTGADLYTHPGGAGVGATRPNGWATFIAMIGGKNPYVQGHSLHHDLGGDGNHDNLSPFTKSLNSTHYHSVEKRVLAHTTADFANYDVTVNYNNNPTVAGAAVILYNTMVGANPALANAAMVIAGVITAMQAAANLPPVVAAAVVPGAQQLLAQAWITNYVNATFGTDIDCSATFFDTTVAGNVGAPHQSGLQQVNITNT
jgi:hypothetical protein